MVASAVTRLPRPRRVLIIDAFLSVAMLASRKKWRTPVKAEVIQWQAASVARVTMFWPAASPVEKAKRTKQVLLVGKHSTETSLPWRVVASASRRSDSIWAGIQSAKSRARRALSNSNTGARCMESPETVQSTPPDALSSFMPRL